MGNILRSLQRQQQKEPVDPHGLALTPANAAIAALTRDLRSFESASMVPEGLGQHVTSSRESQITWYKCMSEAYRNRTPSPRTLAEAAQLVATALNWIPRVDLEGIFEFYNFPISSLPAASSNHLLTSLPEGVQFVLNTLPVNEKCIGDGDGFTAYVSIRDDPRELGNVPREVHAMLTARTQARIRRDYGTADTLRSTIDEAGYKIIICSGNEIVARKYRIRMRGIDAPELKMPYGEESKEALVKLIGGKSTTIYVYGKDQFERYVGDIYCDNVFIQEQMLKNGHVWHFKNYDKRPVFFQWERKARAARKGLWASNNPEKPWNWRRDERNGIHNTIEWVTLLAGFIACFVAGAFLVGRLFMGALRLARRNLLKFAIFLGVMVILFMEQ
uniref:Uncharacterized protein n=1 Tax=Avena sativa TaxID=4498 RepID=A0ACD5Y3W1_AVESA